MSSSNFLKTLARQMELRRAGLPAVGEVTGDDLKRAVLELSQKLADLQDEHALLQARAAAPPPVEKTPEKPKRPPIEYRCESDPTGRLRRVLAQPVGESPDREYRVIYDGANGNIAKITSHEIINHAGQPPAYATSNGQLWKKEI